MEILIALVVIVFCIIGMAVSHGLRIASQEAIRVGDAMVEESKRVQAELDAVVREALASQKPQSDGVVERLSYKLELKGR